MTANILLPTVCVPSRAQVAATSRARLREKFQSAVNKVIFQQKDYIDMKKEGAQGAKLSTNYFLECFTKAHYSERAGKALFSEYKSSDSALSFSLWLDSEESSLCKDKVLKKILKYEAKLFGQASTVGKTLEDFQVTYLDDQARRQYRVILSQQGTFMYPEMQPDTPYIFVLDKNDRLYAASMKVNQFHHSSFLSGRPVKAAGVFTLDPNNKLRSISNASGHYHPNDAQMVNILKYLQTRNVALESVFLELKEVEKPTRHYDSALGFLSSIRK